MFLTLNVKLQYRGIETVMSINNRPMAHVSVPNAPSRFYVHCWACYRTWCLRNVWGRDRVCHQGTHQEAFTR